jgi:hypothetical protein
VAADRRSKRNSGHRRRKSFFSAAAQGQQDGVGIVLEVLDTSPGDETGEAVQVAELLCGWHRPIMTTFLGQGKAGLQAISQVFKEFGGKIHPLDFKKSLSNKRRSLP